MVVQQTKPTPGPSTDEVLDPAVERIRVKLMRLMLLAVGTLLLGLIAVFAAFLYRSTESPSSAAGEAEIKLLPGASVRSTALSESGILVTIDLPDGSVDLVVLDSRNGELRSRTRLVPAR